MDREKGGDGERNTDKEGKVKENSKKEIDGNSRKDEEVSGMGIDLSLARELRQMSFQGWGFELQPLIKSQKCQFFATHVGLK